MQNKYEKLFSEIAYNLFFDFFYDLLLNFLIFGIIEKGKIFGFLAFSYCFSMFFSINKN